MSIKFAKHTCRYRVCVVAPEKRAKVKPVPAFLATLQVAEGGDRLLTFNEKLVKPGKRTPVLAVGAPAIADFVVVDGKRVRITGKKAGLTDLLVINSDGQVFHYEVEVTPRK